LLRVIATTFALFSSIFSHAPVAPGAHRYPCKGNHGNLFHKEESHFCAACIPPVLPVIFL
jgi:hypothetical protein